MLVELVLAFILKCWEVYAAKIHDRAEVDDGDVPLLHRLRLAENIATGHVNKIWDGGEWPCFVGLFDLVQHGWVRLGWLGSLVGLITYRSISWNVANRYERQEK